MLNTAMFKPYNFLVIGLMGITFAILAEHIYNTLIEDDQE